MAIKDIITAAEKPSFKYPILLFPLLAGILVILLSLDKKFCLYPELKEDLKMTTYADGTPPQTFGNSEITPYNFYDDTLRYNYILGKKYQYRYAGISIGLTSDSGFIDLSKYDYLKIKMRQTKEASAALFVKIFNEKFTKIDDAMSHEFLSKNITADTGKISDIIVYFKEFNHPDWWMEARELEKSEMTNPDFSKVISIQIQNGTRYSLDTSVQVDILEISAGKDNSAKFIGLLIFFALYYTTLFLISLYFKRETDEGEKKVVISYEKLDVENDLDQDTKRITETIAKSYSDPAFSVDKLSKEAGISASKIPGILKTQFGMNFKQYLNSIRINEAKRLLKETDNQIVNIAYTVGYNNIPHFNRTFKQLEGVSPKEYRKNDTGEKSED